jgi:hypothetical protein
MTDHRNTKETVWQKIFSKLDVWLSRMFQGKRG